MRAWDFCLRLSSKTASRRSAPTASSWKDCLGESGRRFVPTWVPPGHLPCPRGRDRVDIRSRKAPCPGQPTWHRQESDSVCRPLGLVRSTVRFPFSRKSEQDSRISLHPAPQDRPPPSEGRPFSVGNSFSCPHLPPLV